MRRLLSSRVCVISTEEWHSVTRSQLAWLIAHLISRVDAVFVNNLISKCAWQEGGSEIAPLHVDDLVEISQAR